MARNWVFVYVNMAELLPMSSPEPAKKISEITRNPRINEQISFGISKLITVTVYETKKTERTVRQNAIENAKTLRLCLKTRHAWRHNNTIHVYYSVKNYNSYLEHLPFAPEKVPPKTLL